MGKFVREVSVKVEDGEEAASLRLRPLKTSDLLRLRGSSDNQAALLYYAEVFPSYVIDTPRMPTAADGTPVTLEEFTTAAYFVRLFAEVCKQHISAATLEDPT